MTWERTSLLLSFYGDDFTGSADTMEALSLGGARAALFIEPPSTEQLIERFADLRAVGVAGHSRTMTPAQMDATLPDVFARMKSLGADVFHYKVCSTFDSSPEIGSIGHAIDIGQQVFNSRFVPLLVGAPALKRYCLFGNLFATVGDETFRIDRHPTMSRHPVTPMREGDLRLHLSQQTEKRISLLDILNLTGSQAEVDRNLACALESRPQIVLFDTLDDARLEEAGRLIWSQCDDTTLFIAGSSGVEYALTAHWRKTGITPGPELYPSPGAVSQIIVISGSCSPVTKGQIEWALENGFVGISLDASRLGHPDHCEAERADVKRKALEVLVTGRSVILFSALGHDDPKIEATMSAMRDAGLDTQKARGRLAEQQGMVLRELLEATKLRRAVIVGGDTSSHAARQLGVDALELLTPIAPGSPLCRASSSNPQFDGLEIALKGGQGGKVDYFERVRLGSP